MLTAFRNFAKSKWAVGLFALLILSFLVIGGTQMDVLRGLGSQNVIDAGPRSSGGVEYRTYVERVRKNIEQQAQRPVTIDDLLSEGVLTEILDGRTKELGFLAWAYEAGIRPGPELVVKQVRAVPNFFNQITGQFDEDAYAAALAQEQLTVEGFEQTVRDEAVVSHYASALFAGMRAPRIYGAVLAAQSMETRDGRWFVVTQDMAGVSPAPTDAQLTTFMRENAEQLRVAEFRTVSVVLFTPEASAPAAPTEAQILERFEFRRASLSQPETRAFVTFSAPTQQAAQRIAAALRSGQNPVDVGRANNIEPVENSPRPQTAIADQAVGAAVFGLTTGQISAPIQGQLGWTVAKLWSIVPSRPATLEAAREQIVAELQGEAVQAQVYQKVEQYEAARQEGANLTVAAQRVGARIIQLPPFTAEGMMPDGQPMRAPPQVLATAYSLSEGGESEVIDAGQGQYFAIRLDDVRPAALPALAEIREPLAARWLQRENARRLSARGEALAARIRGGEDIAAVARSAGATLVAQTSVQQNQAAQQSLGEGVFRGLFGQGRGQVFTGPQSATTFAVGRVDAIRPAVAALAAPLVEQVRPRLTEEMARAMIDSAGDSAVERIDARSDAARARAALGLPPEETPAPAAGGTPAEK